MPIWKRQRIDSALWLLDFHYEGARVLPGHALKYKTQGLIRHDRLLNKNPKV